MGQILSTKVTNEGRVIFVVSMEQEEALQLQGHTDDIHIFSEKVANNKANLSMRGKNSATKYFLIPRELRSNLKFNSDVVCQKIETRNKCIFVYVIDKHEL